MNDDPRDEHGGREAEVKRNEERTDGSGEDRRVTEDPARSEVTRRVTKGAN